MSKRSYDERVAEGKDQGFKYPRWSATYFPECTEELLTEPGKAYVTRGIETQNAYVASKKDDYDFFMANKR